MSTESALSEEATKLGETRIEKTKREFGARKSKGGDHGEIVCRA